MSGCISFVLAFIETKNCSMKYLPRFINLCENYSCIELRGQARDMYKIIKEVAEKTRTIVAIVPKHKSTVLHEVLSRYFTSILYIVV